MTFIGKLLVFLNLIVGIGIATGSTMIYTQRPTWFDPIPEGVDKGNSPLTFKQLQAEIDAAARAAVISSKALGIGLAELQEKEKMRSYRRDKFFNEKTGRLAIARTGEKGFFDQTINPATRLIDVDAQGKELIGPDGKPLKGSEALVKQIADDTREIITLAEDIAKIKEKQGLLSKDIAAEGNRLYAQHTIRRNLTSELVFLSGFEINWFDQQATSHRRKKQLDERLKELRSKP